MSFVALAAAGILYGSVTIGPLTPVCHVGTTCDGPAANATLRFTHNALSVAAQTDSNGRYRVLLPAGDWTVQFSVGRTGSSADVVVTRGIQRADFSIDTGIR